MSHSIAATSSNPQDNYFQYDILESDSSKRKNDTQPCDHCQKAQLTCDGSRPCQSCFKRGLATTCTDATRKKQKYLADTHSFPTPTPSFVDSLSDPTAQTIDQFNDASQLLNFSLADLGFGSETAGLEYGIIGNMLQNPLFDLTTATLNHNSDNATATSVSSTFSAAATYSYPDATAVAQFSTLLSPSSNPLVTTTLNTAQPLQPTEDSLKSTSSQLNPPSAVVKRDSMSSAGSTVRRRAPLRTPEAVYNSVKRPFNYAEGFHYLIQYVKEKMSREDLMRISRAMALFRPSFLALIMNLTEEDLIFMEKCMQRTLLEYEKLISFSGTPTVVWRRTGEICLVGKEFSLLTKWARETLLGKRTCIYELMDNRSAVEYWEKFSLHAFDNTDKACINSCILRTPNHKSVPCTFCFTIKRDIFDLPSVIVGNFLPILS